MPRKTKQHKTINTPFRGLKQSIREKQEENRKQREIDIAWTQRAKQIRRKERRQRRIAAEAALLVLVAMW